MPASVPTRILGSMLMSLVPFIGPASEPVSAQHINERLGVGVNLGNALEAPVEGQWGMQLEARFFALISEAGFDSVRIPVRWSAHAGRTAPHTIDPTFVARVDWAVQHALNRGLVVVVNMHHFEELFTDPVGEREAFLAMWRQIAEHYRAYPPALVFEILNEPHDKLTHELWNPLLADAVRVIRASNPTRALVVGPAGWNAYSALDEFRLPPGDEHLIATFHYYLPFQFTHQGASWTGADSATWLGTRWEGTPAEKAEVTKHLSAAATWARHQGVPLYLGEFGAYEKADLASRIAWTRFVRNEARRLGMSVAYWEFGAGFGVYDRTASRWRTGLRDALVGED